MERHGVTLCYSKPVLTPILAFLSLAACAHSQQSTSTSASGIASTCSTSTATQAKPVECLVYRPLYFKSGNDVFMGACIYLGVDIPTFWSTVLDYNWVQVYTTNYDPSTKCAPDKPHTDPCTSDTGRRVLNRPARNPTSPLYRPGDENDAFTGAAAHQWGMSHVFRDMPNRELADLAAHGWDKDFHWDASLTFVRVPMLSNQQSYIPIENISYGFTIKNSVLTLKPLVINGVQVAAQQTRSLNDTPDEVESAGNQTNACITYDIYKRRLEGPPAGYTPPPFPKR